MIQIIKKKLKKNFIMDIYNVSMKIKKRDGHLENLSFDKIVYRLKKLANDKTLGQLKSIDTDVIAQKVVSTIYDGVSSTELDEEAARIAIGMTENLEFAKLASRIMISNMHKNTTECFSEVMEKLYSNIDKNGNSAPILADDIIEIVRKNKDILNETINYSRDYLFDYFGFKTFEKSYLMKINGKVIERPQHLYMRVSIQVHKNDIENIIKTYNLISQHYFTFASPTMFNAGSRLQNLSSCFHEDTIVATVNKGPIKIKDVEIGDLVITHLGNVKKVEQLHKNLLNNRKLYEINIAKTEKIKVTDNHKLWAITKRNKNSRTSYTSPRWISIQDLEKGDYISIPNKIQNIDYIKELDTLVFKDLIENKKDRKSNYTVNLINNNKIILKTHWEHNGWTHVENSVKCSREHSSINRYWTINNSFAKFLGIFYGDGHIMTGKDTDGNLVLRGIGITIHNMNNELLDYCKEIGLEIFGINPTIHIMKEQNIIQVLYNSIFIGEIFNELFGRHFNNKKIWYEMYKWDREMIISLLEGLVTTDGCISKNNGLSFQMSNVKFMRELYYLLRNNNIDTSYGKEKRAKNGTENHVQINIPISEIDKYEVNKYYKDNRMKYEYKPMCKNQFSAKIIDGFKFLKFEDKIEITENLPEYVYTLGVEDDHSYNVGGIIAENCFLMGTDDSIGGIFKTISDCAQISKVGGGIGVHINNIRSKGTVIRGTNGHSDGIIPMLKVYNEVAKYVNQCILPHIPVFSKDGIKRMDEITTNDYLITHDGTFKKVNEVIVSKKKEEILEINIACGIEPLKCTKIHDIYTIKFNRTNSKARLLSQLERGFRTPEFIEAGKLTINDYVGFPIPTFEQDNLNWSLDKCRLYGIMLGDGNISLSKDGGNRYQITLNNDTKLETKAFVIEQLLKNNIQYWISNECEIHWGYKTENIKKIGITYNMLYDKNHDKYCVPEVLHLPKNKMAMIMKGLMESDGYKTNTGVFFSSTSKNLIQSLRYMCLRFGILTSCQTVDKIGQVMNQNKKGKDIISRKIAYYLRLPKIQLLKDYNIIDGFKNTNIYNYFEFKGILYCRIKSINKINYEGEVYDFNMIDNHNYLTDMGLVHNSGKRKGSFAMYLSPEHPDIFEFLDLRKNQGSEDLRARDLFLAMWISDLFMKQVEIDGDWYLMDPDECPGLNEKYGDEYEQLYWKYVEENRFKRKVKAQDIWLKILESQIETGTPYMLYKDASNKKSNQKNIGTIKSSNLCVAPETMILTSNGYYKIQELENQEVDVWNGQEFTKTKIQKTAENQELIKVKLSNGSELECTPYHKFYIATGKRPSNYPVIKKIDAKDLTKNMKLIKTEFPIIKNGLSDFPYPYEHGLFSADATVTDKKETMYQSNPRITLYGEKKKLVKYISSRLEVLPEDGIHNNKTITVRLPMDLKPKFEVPMNYNIDIKLRWLEGLSDGDGYVCNSDNLTGIQISSIDKEFLQKVKYMLQTLGCDPKIVLMHEKGEKLLPNQKGGKLLITSWDTAKLYELGFRPKRLNISGIYPKNNTKRWVQVKDIIETNRISDTYCFKEEKRGMGIFNGVLTGQCAEILLYSDNEEYAVCFTGDTQILTDEGYKRIDECDDKNVLSYFNNDIDLQRDDKYIKAKLINNGKKKIYELKCSGVRRIKVTDNHPFVVIDTHHFKQTTYKWKTVNELLPTDKILIPENMVVPAFDNILTESNLNKEYVSIGWMLGDGWQTNKTYGVCFGPNDTYARDIVIAELYRLSESVEFMKNGYNKNSLNYYTDKNGVFNWACSKKNFIKYIQDTYDLLPKKSHYKEIPDKIKNSKPIEIASFLSGLFSADGTVYINEKAKRFYVGLSSASETLLGDIQILLKTFGINSRIVYGYSRTKNNYQGKLTIETKNSIINYHRYINFFLTKEKQAKLERGLQLFNKRDVFRSFCKIESLTYIGEEVVYDLNVPDRHNFVAENFVVHNCNLASIALPKYVEIDPETKKPFYNHQKLYEVAKHIVLPMNNVIDFNHYPVPETEKSNLAHRPIGVGVQGLSDTYLKMRYPFESDEANKLNKEIFETIYFALLTGSMELAKKDGAYSTFKGSPMSDGKLQFDLWAEDNGIDLNEYLSGQWDWNSLKNEIKEYGVRNSTLTTCMPTASSAQIMGNTESFEPFDSCIFKRRVLSGEYIVANKHLVEDLTKLKLWNKEMKDLIIANNGSIQDIDIIPDNIKELYKTVWEIKMKDFIDQSAQRGPFIDMTQSLNLFMANPTIKKLTSMHFYAWKRGLKTGIYYLRSKASVGASKFTIDPNMEKRIKEKQKKGKSLTKKEEEAVLMCSIENRESCELCSS